MKDILKLEKKISLRLTDRDGGLYVDEPIEPEFSQMWSRVFQDQKICVGQNIRPVMENEITGMNIIFSELHKSGPLVLNVGDASSSFEFTIYPRGHNVSLGIFDITGTRSLQRQIQRQRDALELIDHAHPGALFQVKRDANLHITLDFASPRLSEIMQINELTIDSFLTAMDEATRHNLYEAFRHNQGDVFFEGILDSPHKRFWQIRASELNQQDGVTTFLGVLENTTEKMLQLEQIEYTSAFLRSITQNIPIGIAVSNIPEKSYLYVNQQLCHMTGHNEEDFLTQGLKLTRDEILLDNPDFFAGLDRAHSYYASADASPDHAFEQQIRIKHKNGEERYLQVTFRPLHNAHDHAPPDIFIHLSQDITERLKLEKQQRKDEILLIQSNKMAELGEMASCLAHEINNPLSILSHLLENIESRHHDPEISLSFQTLERISTIVKALIGFARDAGGQGPGPKPIALKTIINDTMLLCQNRLTNKSIHFDITGDLEAMPYINETLLSQVLLNLINNSYDALDNNVKDKWLKLEAKIKNKAVTITFSDSGVAPAIETMQSWFEPFYTSKDKGKGTGLGLSICQNLLRAAGGAIRPLNMHHTSFQISLPLWPKNTVPTESP